MIKSRSSAAWSLVIPSSKAAEQRVHARLSKPAMIWSGIAIAVTMVIEWFHHLLNNDLRAASSRGGTSRRFEPTPLHHESRLPPRSREHGFLRAHRVHQVSDLIAQGGRSPIP